MIVYDVIKEINREREDFLYGNRFIFYIQNLINGMDRDLYYDRNYVIN